MIVSSDCLRGVGQPLVGLSPLQVLVRHYYDRIVSQILAHRLVVRRCIVIVVMVVVVVAATAELDCDGLFYVRDTLTIAYFFFLTLELGDGVSCVGADVFCDFSCRLNGGF